MSLWVDKYRPSTLAKLDYHREQAERLEKMVAKGNFPHLLIYGPPGAGKKTRVMALLRELYGPGVEKLRMEHQNFTTPSNKKIEVMTVASNYHIEVNPNDAGIYDRIVIQEMIKNIAQAQQLDIGGQREFKVVVLTEVDKLTKDAQHALRRTMEKYMTTCRLILCANSTSKIIAPLQSRCLGIRVPAPTQEDVIKVLQMVSKKEGINLPDEFAIRLAEKSERNLRRALLMLEACKVQQYPFNAKQEIVEPDWEVYLRETGQKMVSEQSPKALLEVRGRIYELLSHCIAPEMIIKKLLGEILKNCDGQLKAEITSMAAYYEHRLCLGSKVIFHIEAFIAKFMAIYKRFLEESFANMM
ncbi:replication factor C subunit 3 [Daphnia magna]|uniref:Replication factor C subunit 3 n=2 Tax=Daphnia magna TaxID=35525 RepID=A0A0P6CPC7_9CRUS|nr:replication factor C subunit 3 [Daphnia magna]XP_045030756.1 replication factor C subunit 3 [Daphnia magna]XP_045030757.1 replication factor C subunit 3 [Daphnia magna]XP_045030758.1 replication factor C subunit 3 [Daphnia magna]XP_045030759.1 replication factor C subunit 3 [Daphnia magna]XP_045030760.1 replication factor C subunit 3 [Daphnia magna]XP_045030761.1 replication factor C subunit 3 [Daphnia magna]XP_045030762.1 replication factor C subunit 3 [Daphnia magna]XP_045030763.1 repl